MATQSIKPSIRRSRWVALTAIMTSLALVGNYAFVAVPNVELGTTILFLTAWIFGLPMAVWSTLLMSIIFASINPWGGLIPQIWIAQVIGWLYVSLIGSLLGKKKNINVVELAVTGLICTVVFDLITNIAYSLAFSIPFYITILSGLFFLIVHAVSNMILFPLVVPVISKALREQLAGIIWDSPMTLDETIEELSYF